MKKLLALVMALIMVFSLTACGENPKHQEAIDAHTALTSIYNETVELINANATLVPESVFSDYQMLYNALESSRARLESGEEITDEEYDTIIATMNAGVTTCQETKTLIEGLIAEAANWPYTNSTAEQVRRLSEIAAELTTDYNTAVTAATTNGWDQDSTTVAELNVVYNMIESANACVADPSMLETINGTVEELIAQYEAIGPALKDLITRVSTPYGG